MLTLDWMGSSSLALGKDPLKDMGTYSMWYALEGSKPQLENNGKKDGRTRPWDENVLSLVAMTRNPPTLEFLYLNL